MAKKDNKDGDKNLFSKLADLFRSGPVVKRKIKSMDTRVALPNKLDSSSIEIFQKTTSQLYSAITSNAYNNSERLMRYGDFNEMEQTAEIAAALDIWADETCSVDSKGKALHIYSENAQIKKLLDELFYDTINLDFNLRMWARNLCKYGDFVAFIDVHPQFGILNVIPIPINEIEREEGYDKDDPLAVRYRWVSRGNQILENWQIIHMRLLGNDMFLPYGSSVIEAARRIWRQLILIEDAMLVYRIVRAPDRRVFYIDVGNIEPDQIPNYVEQQRSALRSNQVIDRTTGRVDLRYNPMCLSQKTLIKLQDDRVLTLNNIINEWNAGNTNMWVHSVDLENKHLAPGKIIWAGITRKDTELVRVHLDDKTWYDCTPDHRWMMRNGEYKEASLLNPGDALMPLYTKLSSKKDGDNIVGYEKSYNPFKETYEFTHRINANTSLQEQRETVRAKVNWSKNNNLTVHHMNCNRRDNSPENLQWMGNSDHFIFHAETGKARLLTYNKSDRKRKRTSELNIEKNSIASMQWYNSSDLHASHNTIRSKSQHESWNKNKKQRSEALRWNITDPMFDRIEKLVSDNMKFGRSKIHSLILADEFFMNELSKSSLDRDIKKFSYVAWEGELKRRGYEGLPALRNSIVGYKNHKVERIEFLSHKEDTGCITVENYHNFAAGPSVECLTSDKLEDVKNMNSFIYLHNSVDEDYFIPVRGGDTGTKIDTLAGGQNTAAVEDVEYIQKKLFAALKIPKAYLGFDEMLSSKATLAQEDIRFSRSVQMVQRTIVSELNKLAIIHLFAHGFTGEDLINFTLKLSNPSSVAQQQKLELFKSKFEIAALAPEGLLSKEFILKNIIELTDEEINDIQNGLIDDKEFAAKLEASGATAGGAEGAPGGEISGELGATPESGTEEAPAGEEQPPENAGRGERDGLIVASNNKSKKPSALLDIDDDDIDFTEKIDYQNNLPLYKKVKYGVRDRATKRGAHKTHHMPKFNDMLSVKKNKDITGLDSLKADLNPSFLNENSELRILMEKLPDRKSVV